MILTADKAGCRTQDTQCSRHGPEVLTFERPHESRSTDRCSTVQHVCAAACIPNNSAVGKLGGHSVRGGHIETALAASNRHVLAPPSPRVSWCVDQPPSATRTRSCKTRDNPDKLFSRFTLPASSVAYFLAPAVQHHGARRKGEKAKCLWQTPMPQKR